VIELLIVSTHIYGIVNIYESRIQDKSLRNAFKLFVTQQNDPYHFLTSRAKDLYAIITIKCPRSSFICEFWLTL